MLGELIATLDRPDVADSVLHGLEPTVRERLKASAAAASMTPSDFAAGAVRAFVEQADDNLWFQLLTHIRQSDDPGLTVVQTILGWVVTER